MSKNKLFLIGYVIVLTTLFSLSTLAATGCFLWEESPYFCQEINDKVAVQQCLREDGCVLSDNFFSDVSCNTLSECKPILCKATCSIELRGSCGSGSLKETEKDLWCKPGCCTFTIADARSCQPTSTKGLCELAARNKGAPTYLFTSSLDSSQCQQACSSQQFASFVLETVTPKEPIVRSAPTSSNTSTFSPLLWLLILASAALLAYLLYHYRNILPHPSTNDTSQDKGQKTLLTRLFSPFSSNPQRKAHLEQLKKEHQIKTKQKERSQLLAENNLAVESATPLSFRKLQKVILRKNLRNSMESSDPFSTLQNLSPNKGKKDSSSSKTQALENLRKIAKKK